MVIKMLRGSDTRLARYFTRYLIDVARYRAYLNNGIYPRLKYRAPLDNLIVDRDRNRFPSGPRFSITGEYALHTFSSS